MMKIKHDAAERHVLIITVDNEAGILAKIAGLFTARGYNIDSLTVGEISENHTESRITIVTNGPSKVIDQIQAQLERLVPVHSVVDLNELGPHVERELALIKLEANDKAHAIAADYGAREIDATGNSVIFELTDTPHRIDSFIHLLNELGATEVTRTGVVAMVQGA